MTKLFIGAVSVTLFVILLIVNARLKYCRENECWYQAPAPCVRTEMRIVVDHIPIGVDIGGGLHVRPTNECVEYGSLPEPVKVSF